MLRDLVVRERRAPELAEPSIRPGATSADGFSRKAHDVSSLAAMAPLPATTIDLPRVTPPPALPPCPGLRGEPCRTLVPAANGG